MEVASTVYELTREGENRTRMIWYQHAEPGGSLPAWLVNRLATDIPYESLKELNRVVQEDQYQGYTIEYDNSRPDPKRRPAGVHGRGNRC